MRGVWIGLLVLLTAWPALNATPLWLTTANPNVRSIRDFTENDCIALSVAKVSGQAAAPERWQDIFFPESITADGS